MLAEEEKEEDHHYYQTITPPWNAGKEQTE